MAILRKTFVIFLSFLFAGCSFSELMAKARREDQLTQAIWKQARVELEQMCVQTPDDCQPRWLVRPAFTGRLTMADWDLLVLPPYKTIIDTHERLFRDAKEKGWRGGDFEGLWIHEEILFGIARVLAERADSGEITPEEGKAAYVGAANKAYEEALKNITVVMQNAKMADAETMKLAIMILIGVAAAATSALAIAAAARPVYTYAPRPGYYAPRSIYCNANRTVTGFSVSCF
jgi:hypothetical protein